MSASVIRLLIDFGLLILIWIIQLIVYPSFLYYNAETLVIWHRKYTSLIGYMVAPLMLVQLGLSIYQISAAFTLYNLISVLIISVIWIITFLQFVPIHSNISKGRVSDKMLSSLVRKNWSRTILWTMLFVYSFLVMFPISNV